MDSAKMDVKVQGQVLAEKRTQRSLKFHQGEILPPTPFQEIHPCSHSYFGFVFYEFQIQASLICDRLKNTGHLLAIFSTLKALRKLLNIPVPLGLSPTLDWVDVGRMGIPLGV